MEYEKYLEKLDKKLEEFFEMHKEHIFCKKGCSDCCEKGDYPLSQAELEYLMKGYIALDSDTKKIVQNNIKNMQEGMACPFLINKSCSVYQYRPLVCRTFGLAYFYKEHVIKIPHCVEDGKNYSDVYKNGHIKINPINMNLDTRYLVGTDCGEIHNLYDWLKLPRQD